MLIFDLDGEFIKQVKHYCGKKIDVEICNSKEDFIKLNISNYSIAFVIINTERHFDYLLQINSKINLVLVGTYNPKIKHLIIQNGKTNLIDIENKKNEIMDFIFNYTIGFEINKISYSCFLE